MDTVSKFVATQEQCDELIKALKDAKKKANDTGEMAYARVILEQMMHNGPWQLTIGVCTPEGRDA